eukprot:11223162-Lingulodinium_polyedra.AAC.1
MPAEPAALQDAAEEGPEQEAPEAQDSCAQSSEGAIVLAEAGASSPAILVTPQKPSKGMASNQQECKRMVTAGHAP